MTCKKCKKECLESELKNGYCSECFKEYSGDINKLKINNNSVSIFFRISSIVVIILGIFLGIIAFATSYGIFISLSCVFAMFIFSVFLIAIAEIIQLLEDIKNK